jgi:prephenate dehydrogenase
VKKRWDRVTVVGCGLVGASFALAVRRAGVCARVAGWDADPAALDEALRLGAIDEVDEAFREGGVSRSDLIYLATPVGQVVEFLRGRAAIAKLSAARDGLRGEGLAAARSLFGRTGPS